MIRRPPRSPLFPSTPLFRSLSQQDKVPGEISRHGMGQVDVRFKNGEVKSLNFFATRLEYSRWIAVSIVEDQSIESLVRALVDRKSTRLNSSHLVISYAVFCL